ncbi:hypothetical protein GQ54DRAFT_303604 [Martensiomyces pterosporus]|nr:hypothetical protein GQ54DRAFT_303604 [Martensiomyces pterosporus]
MSVCHPSVVAAVVALAGKSISAAAWLFTVLAYAHPLLFCALSAACEATGCMLFLAGRLYFGSPCKPRLDTSLPLAAPYFCYLRCGADSETASLSGESCVDSSVLESASVRESLRPTIFEEMSHNGIDWCRYCGTTEGINWRPGPWGKRTLCNKHGCDYKGYGFASKMPRLNLKSFADESLEERIRPVLQTFCQVCQQDFSETDNILAHCDGCHRAYHQACHPDGIPGSEVKFDSRWYCEPSCLDNVRRRRIVVELPKCRLPYMCSPRHSNSSSNSHGHHAAAAASQGQEPASRPATAAATAPPRHTRSRKRKAHCALSPSRDGDEAETKPAAAPAPGVVAPKSSSKVRKSSRVTRPSTKRLESDVYAI